MEGLKLKKLLHWMTTLSLGVVFLGAVPSEARERSVRKNDVQKYVQEGEYDLNGTRSGGTPTRRPPKRKSAVSQHPKRSVASKKGVASRKKTFAKKVARSKSGADKSRRHFASVPKRKPSKPAKKLGKKPTKKSSKKLAKKKKTPPRHHSVARASRYQRVPRVRATPNENDMPFVSVPNSKVRKDAKTIEMVDPSNASGRDPEGPSQTALHPDRVSPPVAAPVSVSPPPETAAAPQAPQTIPMESAASGPREPDAYDMHSGADPLRGNGPAPAEAPAATGL